MTPAIIAFACAKPLISLDLTSEQVSICSTVHKIAAKNSAAKFLLKSGQMGPSIPPGGPPVAAGGRSSRAPSSTIHIHPKQPYLTFR